MSEKTITLPSVGEVTFQDGEVNEARETASLRRSKRGFASMSKERQREIASRGGKAAHAKGCAHEFDSSEARAAGQKGGKAILRIHGREHFRKIGRKGGENRGKGRAARSA